MKKLNKKDMIIVLLVIILIIIGVVVVVRMQTGNQNQTNQTNETTDKIGLIDYTNTTNAKIENGVKINTSPKLAEEKEFEGMKIKNIQLKAQGEDTYFTASIENATETDFEGKQVNIVLKNDNGDEFAIVDAYIDSIKAGESLEFASNSISDIANAYDFYVKLPQ